MNGNESPEAEAALSRALREWTVQTPLPPRFQDRVWQRIEQTDARPAPRGAGGLRVLLESWLPRPRFAFAYLTCLLALGVAAGAVAAQIKSTRLEAELGGRYLQAIDPYLPPGPQP